MVREKNRRQREHGRGGRARDKTASGIGERHGGQNSTERAAMGTRQHPRGIRKLIAQRLGGDPLGYKHR